jgi:hypothetical protein
VIDCEGFGRKPSCISTGTVPVFVWRDWRRPRKYQDIRCLGRESNPVSRNADEVAVSLETTSPWFQASTAALSEIVARYTVILGSVCVCGYQPGLK